MADVAVVNRVAEEAAAVTDEEDGGSPLPDMYVRARRAGARAARNKNESHTLKSSSAFVEALAEASAGCREHGRNNLRVEVMPTRYIICGFGWISLCVYVRTHQCLFGDRDEWCGATSPHLSRSQI